MKYGKKITPGMFAREILSELGLKIVADNVLPLLDIYQDGGIDEYVTLDEGEYRVISEDIIDDVLINELKNDPCVLGAFADWVLADTLGVPLYVVQALQEHGEYETLGHWVIDADKIIDLARICVQNDGYGNHFAHYDGYEHYVPMYGIEDVYIFRVG